MVQHAEKQAVYCVNVNTIQGAFVYVCVSVCVLSCTCDKFWYPCQFYSGGFSKCLSTGERVEPIGPHLSIA